MATQNDVIKTLMAMGEIYGKVMSEAAASIFIEDLSAFAPDSVLLALKACRRELTRFPTTADVIARLEALDGRPGAEEAWAMIPQSEDGSVVWNDEMATAFGAAYPLLKIGDPVAARMAFKERYIAAVKEARDSRQPVRWQPSFGHDKATHAAAVNAAVASKRITIEHAASLLPELPAPKEKLALTGPTEEPNLAENRKRIRGLLSAIGSAMPKEGEE